MSNFDKKNNECKKIIANIRGYLWKKQDTTKDWKARAKNPRKKFLER